jgi:hypothetical protein
MSSPIFNETGTDLDGVTTVSEVAEFFDVTVNTIHHAIRKGWITSRSTGKGKPHLLLVSEVIARWAYRRKE